MLPPPPLYLLRTWALKPGRRAPAHPTPAVCDPGRVAPQLRPSRPHRQDGEVAAARLGLPRLWLLRAPSAGSRPAPCLRPAPSQPGAARPLSPQARGGLGAEMAGTRRNDTQGGEGLAQLGPRRRVGHGFDVLLVAPADRAGGRRGPQGAREVASGRIPGCEAAHLLARSC